MKAHVFLAFCFLGSLALTAVRAAAPAAIEDLPVRPNFLTQAAADASDVAAPLATDAEVKAFHAECDELLRNADRLLPKDRVALYELLEMRSKRAATPGAKRLLLLAAFHEAIRSAPSVADLDALGQETLDALDGATIALTTERVAMLTELHRRMPENPTYAPAADAEETFTLAELQFDDGRFADAAKELLEARHWTDMDVAYGAKMESFVDRFAAEVQRQAEAERQLRNNPGDEEANRILGFSVIGRSASPEDAVGFLVRSGPPPLLDLGVAIAVGNRDAAARLKIAETASGALPWAEGEDRYSLACLIRLEAKAIATDAKASEKQKASAEDYLNEARIILAAVKSPPESVNPPVAAFFKLQGPGRRIVFIVDGSGSMLDNFDFLRQALIQSVDALKASQKFDVVVVSQIAPSFVYPEPQSATAATKKDFAAKMGEYRAEGWNENAPQPFQEAFEKAFAMRPDAIFFLTDGHFDPRLAKAVGRLNSDKKVHVNTLALVNGEPSYQEQLKAMAKGNGGVYKFVSEKDLGK